MRNDRVLLFLVVADFVLVMLTFAGEFALNSTLPLPLRDYTSSTHAILTSIVWFPVLMGFAVITLVSWIGLLNYWWPARILYVCAWALWILLVAVSGPSVTPAAVATIEILGNLVGGAIIGLVFFSDLTKRFDDAELEMATGGR
jgi:hypothetical protein